MDLSDELRTDFYDFINPKLEPGTIGLTPVAFIDSVDYSVSDSNNNLGGGNGPTNMKSFLDEMLFESGGGNMIMNGGSTGSTTNSSPSANSNGDETEHISLPSINSTFELMGSYWGNLNNGNLTDSASDSTHQWLSSPETEVTTLTNLLDPLFVSYDNADISSLNLDNSKAQYFTTTLVSTANSHGDSTSSITTNPTMVSSNHITTTFHNDNTSKSYMNSPSETIILNGGDHEIIWQKQDSPNSPFIYCDESLLRSALQTGKPEIGAIIQSGNINLNITSGKTNNSNSTMTELRKVLDYPPLSVNSDSTSTQSPSSTSTTSPIPPNLLEHHVNIRQPQQFEFKMVDPMFHSQIETIIIDEANIPNVEELIMTRIDNKGTKKMEISERKINSTTLSTKWTYTTNAQSKAPKRRRTKQGVANAEVKQVPNLNSSEEGNNENSISQNSESSRSPTNSNNNNGTSRKERSLHYCNICNKGFKDKYSVNVHVRTHTGEKPFGCFCGKHFRQKAHLAKHHQTHAAKANGHQGKGKRASS